MAALTARSRLAACAAALAAAWPLGAAAQRLDFAQADTSSESTSVVLVRALPSRETKPVPGLLSATFTRWDSGDAGSIGYVHRWAAIEGPHRWLVGAGVGANLYRSRAAGDEHRESALSLRLQTELSGTAPGGAYYALAQASTFRGAWLATVQYTPSGQAVTFEALSYHEPTYRADSIGLRIRVGAEKWFVRFGATRSGGDRRTAPYIGVAYNGF